MADQTIPTKIGSYYGRREEVDGAALAASGRRFVVTVRIGDSIRAEIHLHREDVDGHPIDYLDALVREVGEAWVRENAEYSWALEDAGEP